MSFLGGLGGGAIGGAVVNLYLDDKQFKAGLAGAEATTKSSTGRIGSVLKGLGISTQAAATAIVGAVALGAAASINAASDQEEALNKVRVVFGETSAAVEEFASTAAENLGLSEAAALSAAGTFGNFFTAAGLASDSVADMSTGIVQLSADLASFNNIPTDVALEKLRAGLAGEAEPLRQVGVFLSEARVQQEAYTSGIAAAGTELTDAQKIQARYNLILQDTTLAQGDFARTSDSFANQQRILAAQFTDLAATIGKVLLPAMSAILGVILELLTNLPLLTKAVVAFGGAWVAFNFNAVLAGLGSMVGFIKLLPGQLAAAVTAMSGLRLATIGTIGAIAAVGVGGIKYQELNDQLQMLKERGIQADGAINLLSMDFDVNADAVRLAYEKNLSYEDALKQVEAGAAGAAAKTAALTAKVKESEKAAKEAAKAYREGLKESFSVAGESAIGFKAKFEGTVRSFTTGLNNMRRRAKETLDDLREFNKIDLGKGVKEFLLDQGPAAIDAFVDANKKGRDNIVDDIQAIIKAHQGQGREIDEATGKTNNLTGAMTKLGQKKVTAEARIRYMLSEDSLDPGSLPGLGANT